MSREGREPSGITRKKKRRAPQSLEQIERNRHTKFRDEYEDKHHKKKVNRKKSKRYGVGKKIFLAIAAILVIILISSFITIASFFSKVKNDETIAATPVNGNVVNILVLGMDIGDVTQVNNKSIKRTDTIMLINYNKSTKKTQIISIPRDTLVNENKNRYKINAAFESGGDKKIKSVVESMLSTTINYIVKIDYGAFRGFIDAIGGIDMEIERNMIYDDPGQNLHINFKKGTTEHLDGKKAEEFFRWRKNNDGSGFANGDLDRIENQHKFLQKIVAKCKTPTIFFKIPKILDTVAKNMDTNMSSFNMLSYGMKLLVSGGFDMKTIQGDPQMIDGQSYLVFKKESNKELLESLKTGKVASNTDEKKDIKVMVLNGTKINGLAGKVKTELEVLGWSRVDTGNCDPVEKSIIKTDDNNIKKIMSSDMPEATKFDSKPEDEKYSSYDVVLIIGSDYKKLGE
ncbi:LCP family protein [Clostridium sp. SHJSY1]|uniref:LCP family protein n=1 Tax=Clostridium sp. SHJSY1 TaxID=2942483 RepID=UPI00287695CB|nr:LCP family protein [Clostridium sp. SHJSY1]MDS0528388.1 LCP family protein [Clostridium sp. SHJSY1]